MSLSRLAAAMVAAVVVAPLLALTSPAHAVQATQQHAVSALPPAYTPSVNDGAVTAIGQSGQTVVIGGSFTSVTPHGSSTTYTVQHLAAFTAGSGSLVTTFAPTLNGPVNSVIAGPTHDTVYVAGDFTVIDGKHTHLALIDTTTGAIARGWKSQSFNGTVNAVVRSGSQLFAGGLFTAVANSARAGLVVLDDTTGAIESYATPAFAGHHNYGRLCDPAHATCASASTGIKAMDVNPAGTRLVVIGNFTQVSDLPRDQIALIDLTRTGASVDPAWATDAYTAACSTASFDSYVRDVQFSPDGAYFVVAATGGGAGSTNTDGTRTSCDTAARYETSGTGSDLRPTWIDYTGNDTFLSLALTGTVVYVGGHERWVNNTFGADSAQEGAVPRPGIVALDPVNGMPLAWNPGRNPRGAGASALLATDDGLYVGSDTDYVGNFRYHRKKLAFFPLADGASLAANQSGSLPGTVYLLGSGTSAATAQAVAWNGHAAPGPPVPVTAVDWSTARGAFMVNDQVYYGSTDGNFYRRSFDGTSFGPAVAIDPYDDPAWDDVDTGSGQTYRGLKSSFYGELSSLTSMFYSNGRVYYTRSGDPKMHWRWFEPDSGVMGADEFTTTDSLDWSHVAGAFLSGSTLYYADSASTHLNQVAFTNGEPTGTPTVADSAIDWTSHGAFVKAVSTIRLAVRPAGQGRQDRPMTLTATVALASDSTAHPAGTVTFTGNAKRLGSATVDSVTGKAALTIRRPRPSAPDGTLLTATFHPDDVSVERSAPATLRYTVNPVATRPHLAGKARVGAKVRCVEPSSKNVTVRYAWAVAGKQVKTGASYRVRHSALHKRLACSATVSIGSGDTSTARSKGVKVKPARSRH